MELLDKYLLILKKALKNDMVMLPSFIDNRQPNHRECYSISGYVFTDIDKLLVNKTLTSKRIIEISLSCDIYFSEMIQINQDITILYYNYFQDILKTYIEYSIENELWEAAANIKNFYQEFFKQKIDK